MATVVLLGFSCAGKSRLITSAQEMWPQVIPLDSDERIATGYQGAKGSCKGHIYNIFLKHGRRRRPVDEVWPQDREDAIDVIERKEAEFLDSLVHMDAPRLIAAGPGLVLRKPEFDRFVAEVKPRFIYLRQTVHQAAAGLLLRRQVQLADASIREHPHFGSWDDDVLTRRDGDRWIDLPWNEVPDKVQEHMGGLIPKYEELAASEESFVVDAFGVRTDAGKKAVMQLIAAQLDLHGE